MLSLNGLAKIIVWVNWFILGAVLMAWLTPFSFRVGPRFFPLLALYCMAFCWVWALMGSISQKLMGRSWQSGRFFRRACLSGFSFLASLVVIYALIPPVSSTLYIFGLFDFFLPNANLIYQESVIPHSAGKENVKLICFPNTSDGQAISFLTVDRLWIFRQRLLTLKADRTCGIPDPTPAEPSHGLVSFTWSEDGKYLRWDERWFKRTKGRPTGNIKVY